MGKTREISLCLMSECTETVAHSHSAAKQLGREKGKEEENSLSILQLNVLFFFLSRWFCFLRRSISKQTENGGIHELAAFLLHITYEVR